LLYAGDRQARHKLADCAQRELGRTLDKTEQKGDWSGPLTASQLAYAAADADVLVPLLQALRTKLQAAGLERAAEIETRCLPALVWAGTKGVAFDKDRGQALADQAAAEASRLEVELDTAAPADPDVLITKWN